VTVKLPKPYTLDDLDADLNKELHKKDLIPYPEIITNHGIKRNSGWAGYSAGKAAINEYNHTDDDYRMFIRDLCDWVGV